MFNEIIFVKFLLNKGVKPLSVDLKKIDTMNLSIKESLLDKLQGPNKEDDILNHLKKE